MLWIKRYHQRTIFLKAAALISVVPFAVLAYLIYPKFFVQKNSIWVYCTGREKLIFSICVLYFYLDGNDNHICQNRVLSKICQISVADRLNRKIAHEVERITWQARSMTAPSNPNSTFARGGRESLAHFSDIRYIIIRTASELSVR